MDNQRHIDKVEWIPMTWQQVWIEWLNVGSKARNVCSLVTKKQMNFYYLKFSESTESTMRVQMLFL